MQDIDDFFTISNPDDLKDKSANYKKLYLIYSAGLVLIPAVGTRITYIISPNYMYNYMENNMITSFRQAYFRMMAESIIVLSSIFFIFSLLIFIVLFFLFRRDKKRVMGRVNVSAHQHNPMVIKVKEGISEEYIKNTTWAERNPDMAYFLMMLGAGMTALIIGTVILGIANLFL